MTSPWNYTANWSHCVFLLFKLSIKRRLMEGVILPGRTNIPIAHVRYRNESTLLTAVLHSIWAQEVNHERFSDSLIAWEKKKIPTPFLTPNSCPCQSGAKWPARMQNQASEPGVAGACVQGHCPHASWEPVCRSKRTGTAKGREPEHPEEDCDFDKNGSEVWGWGAFLVAWDS